MSFTIRKNNSQEDITFLCKSCFQTAKDTQAIQYNSLKEQNPDKNEEELFVLFSEEIVESFDFTREDCRIYIIEDEKNAKLGYIWVAIRDSEDSWDLERPLWIFDISVLPKYRRRGLARQLLNKAEEFAVELGRNIGLFVHEHNKSAISLYKSSGYKIKMTLVSLKLTDAEKTRASSTKFTLREAEDKDETSIFDLGLSTFKRLVRYSIDASDEAIIKKYRNNNEKFDEKSKRYSKYVVESADNEIVAFVLVGVAYFSDEVGLLYDAAIKQDRNTNDLQSMLLRCFRDWSFERGLSTAYILLHTEEDISREICSEMRFKVPGYFMEKKLK